MKNFVSFIFMALAFSQGLFSIPAGSSEGNLKNSRGITGLGYLPGHCTVFTISSGGSVFFGGNDDYNEPDSYYWVEKGDSSRYGVIWIGQPDNVQQGVNEKGLAYDANGLPRTDVNPHSERIPVPGDYTIYPVRIMHECATVGQVISWINAHQWHSYMHDQMQFADPTGDAVIISAGKDGELVFTRKSPGDGFLVSTNFNVANPENSYGYPCWRYDTATRLLGELTGKKAGLSYKDAAGVLEAVHMEKGSSWTIESMLADLVKGEIYLYYYYQFDHPVIINVKEELLNPHEAGPLSKLFPEDVRQEAAVRYRHALAGPRICRNTGIAWATAVFLSLLAFAVSARRKKGKGLWLPAFVFLGPVAFLFTALAHIFINKPQWRSALLESTGDVIPVVVTYTVAFTIIIHKAMTGATSTLFQFGMMIGLPVAAGWLIFHVICLLPVKREKPFLFVFQRLPQVLVTTFLGLAGIILIALPLANHSLKNLNMSQLIPLSPWVVIMWWAIIAMASVVGMILVFLYEYWAVKKGFKAWTILEEKEGEASTPSLRKIWWWIPVSTAVLIAGLVGAVKFLY